MGWLRSVFVGPRGVRAGWRFLAFIAVARGLGLGAQRVIVALGLARPGASFWDVRTVVVGEVALLLTTLLATAVLLVLERRSPASAGLRFDASALRDAGTGALWGAAAPTLVLLAVWVAGAWSPGGFRARGGALLAHLALWLGVFLLVGVGEELLFRGYALFRLSDGMGFWPTAVLLSLLFGAAHLGKPDENAVDISSIVLIGVFLCVVIWRTGALWWAMGFHAAFDFFALWVYGAPNAGQQLDGRLLESHFTGPAWLTGGPLGLEASVLMFVVTLAMLALFLWRTPRSAGPAVVAAAPAEDAPGG